MRNRVSQTTDINHLSQKIKVKYYPKIMGSKNIEHTFNFGHSVLLSFSGRIWFWFLRVAIFLIFSLIWNASTGFASILHFQLIFWWILSGFDHLPYCVRFFGRWQGTEQVGVRVFVRQLPKRIPPRHRRPHLSTRTRTQNSWVGQRYRVSFGYSEGVGGQVGIGVVVGRDVEPLLRLPSFFVTCRWSGPGLIPTGLVH